MINLKKRENSLFLGLSILMGLVIIVSNYLVQFPINHFGLKNILTYGAFTYPVTFLITDLANRSLGKIIARKVVFIGFVFGILLTLFVSTNFNDLISVRIAIGSGSAFIAAQLIDVEIFQKLRNKIWFIAPITSSFFGSIIDTFIFFSISFFGTDVPWISLAIGDLAVKFTIALLLLFPYRILTFKLRDFSEIKKIQV